jgi:hypothetical protein
MRSEENGALLRKVTGVRILRQKNAIFNPRLVRDEQILFPAVQKVLRGVQLTLVRRFYQLYFLIQSCYDYRKVRAPNAVRERRTCIGFMKVKIVYENTIYAIEHK